MFVMLSHLFIAALCSPAGKGLTSGLSLVMFNCVFVSFPCGILGQAGVVLDCIDSYFQDIHKVNYNRALDQDKLWVNYIRSYIKDIYQSKASINTVPARALDQALKQSYCHVFL